MKLNYTVVLCKHKKSDRDMQSQPVKYLLSISTVDKALFFRAVLIYIPVP